MTHDLKIWPEYFQPVVKGLKTFELRYNDRNFQVGDILMMHEFCPVQWDYTVNWVRCVISFILPSGDVAGLQDGYVILAISVEGSYIHSPILTEKTT